MTLSNDPNSAGKARQAQPGQEDTKENLDARLDHGIKESFPGSDPVSVKVSKYAPGDDPNETETGNKDAYQRARAAANNLSEKVGETVSGLRERGKEYLPRAAEEFRRERDRVTQTVSAHPGPALLLAGVIAIGVGLVAYEMLSSSRTRRR